METDGCFQDTGKEPKRSSGFHASLPTDLSWEADTGICVAITDGVTDSRVVSPGPPHSELILSNLVNVCSHYLL